MAAFPALSDPLTLMDLVADSESRRGSSHETTWQPIIAEAAYGTLRFKAGNLPAR